MGKRRHPFWRKDPYFKYVYCFGLGVMSMGHMKAITETKDYFEHILNDIGMPEEEKQQIFLDINNQFETRIEEVFSHIRTKEEQYCFVLDLYGIMGRTSWAREYCEAVLSDFLQIFQFSPDEKRFFHNFASAMYHLNKTEAVKAYEEFIQQGFSIRYMLLTWAFPDFYYQERYEDIRIASGQTLLLDKPVYIRGEVIVERGGSLLIYGGNVEMEGNIQVNGGRIQIDHGKIRVRSCKKAFWLVLQDTAVVSITDTEIDCMGKCGVLKQNMGRLLLEECLIQRTATQCAICFSGKEIRVYDTKFSYCVNGMIALTGAAQAQIIKCDFIGGNAEYGGAVYSESIGDVMLQQCSFVKCSAKYLGAAVYFKYQKLGQTVTKCRERECVPKDTIFFNAFSLPE